ncbi:hypothetical protein PPTG_24209 [Phytophthora nicotianae INRA-310]|uniref:Uncharacterized protein n=1 Tax=Phytophthora nicotianae (strain INRA-310) TaxID=761204 RepID=W2PK67_PHYN3|nr:hypothetical protein PPTG_24209 [Phytophthora nicotianae INRA-310]ETN00644.1 hypothetical protein PPTG_24209 [Phytophthora nicotianae INRA-310]
MYSFPVFLYQNDWRYEPSSLKASLTTSQAVHEFPKCVMTLVMWLDIASSSSAFSRTCTHSGTCLCCGSTNTLVKGHRREVESYIPKLACGSEFELLFYWRKQQFCRRPRT